MVAKHLSIAIPASMISDTPHLREKTAKIGIIARAAAIFQINEIIVYADNSKIDQKKDLELIATLLCYIETPQYLRKRLFELSSDLQYAGILPPLRTPHHPLTGRIKDLQVGDYREGVTVSNTKEGSLIDIGSDYPILMRNKQLPVNQRVTTKIARLAGNQVELELVERNQVPKYWGYEVSVERRCLGKLVDSKEFDLIIGTSKIASSYQDALHQLKDCWKTAKNILILFGAPAKGLHEIVQQEGRKIDAMVDLMINVVPNQGTETIRTEEAIQYTLALLNMHFNVLIQ
ncbi:MAG: RNA-binding protein [Crenarchaeota archaeon]|nr:RNA-binding protein [Thermoproteota archaeon]